MIMNLCQIFKMCWTIIIVLLSVLLTPTPGACISPQADTKQTDELSAFRQAGLTRDRSQIPALLAALKNPPERFYKFTALHVLAQMGVTEALPSLNSILATSHDIDLINYATAAKSRLLAESSTHSIANRVLRTQAKLSRLYQATGLTNTALTLSARSYQQQKSSPGFPVPMEIYTLREAADILYQEGVSTSALEATPPDYSLDPASALKVQLAPLSPKARVAFLVELLANKKSLTQDDSYAIRLLADEGEAAAQAVDAKLVDMDLHQDKYTVGFNALFNVLLCIGDPAQGSFVEDFARDPSREAGYVAQSVVADIKQGKKTLYAIDY